MINIYDLICANSSQFDQVKFGKDNKLFLDYLCPISVKRLRAWSHMNCLMYVLQGTKGYIAKDYTHEAQPHQVIFIRKGGIILDQDLETPYRAMIFMFEDAAIKEFLMEFPDLLSFKSPSSDFTDQHVVTHLKSSSFIESVFKSAFHYLKYPTKESSISLEIKFKELLVNLLRDKEGNSFYAYLSWLCNDSSASFIKLMNENSHYNFTTEELARLACMSLSTFKRVFVKHFGVSPGRWLREQRIVRAKALLANTENSITEIAFELGYCDTAAFSKAFKLATTLNPTDFVKSCQLT